MECHICLNLVENEDEKWVNNDLLPCDCSVVYHKTCMNDWFKTVGIPKCPTCHTCAIPEVVIEQESTNVETIVLAVPDLSIGGLCVCLMFTLSISAIFTTMYHDMLKIT